MITNYKIVNLSSLWELKIGFTIIDSDRNIPGIWIRSDDYSVVNATIINNIIDTYPNNIIEACYQFFLVLTQVNGIDTLAVMKYFLSLDSKYKFYHDKLQKYLMYI